jgi:hypothetical protein
MTDTCCWHETWWQNPYFVILINKTYLFWPFWIVFVIQIWEPCSTHYGKHPMLGADSCILSLRSGVVSIMNIFMNISVRTTRSTNALCKMFLWRYSFPTCFDRCAIIIRVIYKNTRSPNKLLKYTYTSEQLRLTKYVSDFQHSHWMSAY